MIENNRRVAIACQGGGSHTTFTAGTLKRLLKEKAEEKHNYDIVALSGTSGGAICALLTWYGLLMDDTDKAVLGQYRYCVHPQPIPPPSLVAEPAEERNRETR